jgi:hypothetical protein
MGVPIPMCAGLVRLLIGDAGVFWHKYPAKSISRLTEPKDSRRQGCSSNVRLKEALDKSVG